MTLTAALFVGGTSARMGRDKALLEIFGEPLWMRQLNLLRRLKPEVLCISARSKPSWCPVDATVVLDKQPSHGPISGLVATLEQLKTSHLLALAIDLPRMNEQQLARLWAQAQPGRGIVPENAGLFEPLCAIYPCEAGLVARTSLESGELSLQNLVRILGRQDRVEIHSVPMTERGVFLNANSPADLEDSVME
jgi:molybdopterin-guanine dinucleotide biosynthesis protein A